MDAAMFARVLDDQALQAAPEPPTLTLTPTLTLARIKRSRPIPCSLCLFFSRYHGTSMPSGPMEGLP